MMTMTSNGISVKSKKLVIFDMDGLFFDSEAVYALGWKKALDHYQVAVSDHFIASLKGQGAKDNDQAVYAVCKDRELVKKFANYDQIISLKS